MSRDLIERLRARATMAGPNSPLASLLREAADRIAALEERITRADLAALLDEVRSPSASPENHLRQIGVMIERMMEVAGEQEGRIRELVDILERLANPAPGVKRLPAWVYGLIMGPLRRARGE